VDPHKNVMDPEHCFEPSILKRAAGFIQRDWSIIYPTSGKLFFSVFYIPSSMFYVLYSKFYALCSNLHIHCVCVLSFHFPRATCSFQFSTRCVPCSMFHVQCSVVISMFSVPSYSTFICLTCIPTCISLPWACLCYGAA
jgi:hypothetical protein